MDILQTLDRGLEALESISMRPGGVQVQELADQLDVHRAVVYRILATLEHRHLVVRSSDGRYRLGSGVLAVSRRFLSQYRTAVQPLLADLAEATTMTAFLAVAEQGQAVAVAVVEPQDATFGVSYRIGARHDLDRGADGVAILAQRPASPKDPIAVQTARERGVAISRGELQPGAFGMAVGLAPSSAIEASVGVIALGDREDLEIDQALLHIQQARLQLATEI